MGIFLYAVILIGILLLTCVYAMMVLSSRVSRYEESVIVIPKKQACDSKRKELAICTLKIIRKERYEIGVKIPSYVYAVAVLGLKDDCYYPVYPFALTKQDKDSLEEFVSLYGEDLLKFYKQPNSIGFSFYLYGFNTYARERFKEEWYEKGVLIS